MTKAELVASALREIGLADYEFDISTEETTSGVSRLNQMMAMWSDKGIRLSYNYAGASADESGLPGIAEEAVFTNLALRLAPSYGKQVDPGVRALAKFALNALMSESTYPRERQLSGLPVGAGYKNIDYRRFTFPETEYPWRDAGFDDYSGEASAIQVGDVGAAISVDVSDIGDVSLAANILIKYLKPSGEEGQWVGTVSGSTMEYTTVDGDVDEDGVWYLQATFDLGTWRGSSKVTSITVGKNL